MTSASYAPSPAPGTVPRAVPVFVVPQRPGRGLIGLGAVAMLVAFILGVIGASQDPYYDDEYATQATIYGWGVIFGALGFWLMLFGTIIRAGKIAAGRR